MLKTTRKEIDLLLTALDTRKLTDMTAFWNEVDSYSTPYVCQNKKMAFYWTKMYADNFFSRVKQYVKNGERVDFNECVNYTHFYTISEELLLDGDYHTFMKEVENNQ